jgi:PPOX class probable F420-dependent enzyme
MGADLGAARYIAVTTYGRDGAGVTTAVWPVSVGGRLYISTGTRTGKVQRIRDNPDVTVSECDRHGRASGAPHKGVARIIPVAQQPAVEVAMLHKYGYQKRLINLLDRLRRRDSKSFGERILLELVLEDF